MMKTLAMVLTASALTIARAAAAQQPTPAQPPPAAAQPAPTPAAAAALQPAPAMPRVTLEQALELGRRFNPSQVQAQQNLRVAQMGVTQAWGAYLPSITGSGTSTTGSSQKFNSITGGTINGTANSSSFGLSANVNLFTGFQRGANMRAANATRDLNQAALLEQDYATDLNTKQAFFNVLSTQELVGVAQANLAQNDQQLRLTTEKLRLGATTRVDSLTASVAYGTAEVQLIQARANALTAQASLGRAIGLQGMVAATPDTTLEIRLSSLDTAALRQEAEAAAPVVVQAQATVTAAQASLSAQRALYWPTLNLGASQRWAGSVLFPWNGTPAGSSQTYTGTWSVSLSLNYPIFNGFVREGQIVSADANLTAAQAKLRDARLLLDANLTQDVTALEAAAAQIDVSRTSVAAAQESLRMQQERYRLGASTIVDLLTAETALNQAEVTLVEARYNYLIARATLEALVGHTL
ncbi:MAG TPA: TolC family protein [Gemmatimonadales bacterium]|nr:TolC family protein [Gemmatimonadales bacterium]